MTKQKAFLICFAIPFIVVAFIVLYVYSNPAIIFLTGFFAELLLPLFLVSIFLPALIIGKKFGQEFRQNGLYGALTGTALIVIIDVLHFYYSVI